MYWKSVSGTEGAALRPLKDPSTSTESLEKEPICQKTVETVITQSKSPGRVGAHLKSKGRKRYTAGFKFCRASFEDLTDFVI